MGGLVPIPPRILKCVDVQVPCTKWRRSVHTVGPQLQTPNYESKTAEVFSGKKST